MIKVSVIVTNYNYKRFLPECIASIVNESPDELIIVDDGSTDGSVDWLTECRSEYTLILKNNGGQASAMNAGYSKSTCDLVWFVDADDLIAVGSLELIKREWSEKFAKMHSAMIPIQTIDDIHRSHGDLPVLDCGVQRNKILECRDRNSPTSGNVFSSRSIKSIFPIPEDAFKLCADNYLNVSIGLNPENEVGCFSNSIAYYRKHGDNSYAELGKGLSSRLLFRVLQNDVARSRLVKASIDQLSYTDTQRIRSIPLSVILGAILYNSIGDLGNLYGVRITIVEIMVRVAKDRKFKKLRKIHWFIIIAYAYILKVIHLTSGFKLVLWDFVVTSFQATSHKMFKKGLWI